MKLLFICLSFVVISFGVCVVWLLFICCCVVLYSFILLEPAHAETAVDIHRTSINARYEGLQLLCVLSGFSCCLFVIDLWFDYCKPNVIAAAAAAAATAAAAAVAAAAAADAAAAASFAAASFAAAAAAAAAASFAAAAAAAATAAGAAGDVGPKLNSNLKPYF